MKGSKRLGKSILVIALSIVLLISAVAPLTVMGSDNNGGGLKGTSLGQYRYYSVKSGDTLASIASKNGVTVSDIMTYNDLDSSDSIYRGQILKVPVTSENKQNQVISSSITIKAKESNVKDLISSIAYNAGYTVIYKGAGTETVTVDLEKVSPLKAIDYVTRMVGLSYLKDGNTILVATAGELNSTFVDSLVLTKFSFQYITYDELLGQASALGLSNIKTVSQTNNGRDVWISAYPKEMAKIHELVEILDAPENISVGSNSIAAAFTPIELDYISATDFSNLLSSLGLHAGITMSVRPMTLFVYVSGTQLADIMTIKKVVDTEDAITGDNATGTPVIKPDDSTGDNTTNTPSDDTTNDNTNTDDTTTPEEPEEEPITYEKVDLINITRADAESIIARYVEGISVYGHDRMTKSLWLFGTQTAIDNAKAIIMDIDANVASASSTVHTYTAQNCTVEELMNRLEGVKYENVSFYLYDHAAITNSLIVYCDEVTWNNEILELLQTLDAVDTGEKTWIPIQSKTEDNSADAVEAVESNIKVMQELYDGVFGGIEYKTVILELEKGEKDPTTGEITGASYKAVTYAYVTSAQATRMTNLLNSLQNA
ncbi:MAG: LysM peptidoglycan-binding domain-containing protein [Ruminococcaceae bacterium]|nr:LysM peptidoglycan-binding domain-containing protein [Oscillospiraceae bacterium]